MFKIKGLMAMVYAQHFNQEEFRDWADGIAQSEAIWQTYTNDAEWRYIEFVASWLLEGGKPHCIPSIED